MKPLRNFITERMVELSADRQKAMFKFLKDLEKILPTYVKLDIPKGKIIVNEFNKIVNIDVHITGSKNAKIIGNTRISCEFPMNKYFVVKWWAENRDEIKANYEPDSKSDYILYYGKGKDSGDPNYWLVDEFNIFTAKVPYVDQIVNGSQKYKELLGYLKEHIALFDKAVKKMSK